MAQALIVGGGIAGTVTAMALRKAGHDAVVHEAYGHSAEGVGAFLTLAVNGVDALAALELDHVVKDLGFATPRIALHNGNGKVLGNVTSGGALDDGTVGQTLMRSDLYVALRDEAARRGVRFEYGKRLKAATTSDTGVRAEFADGTSANGDLLIGADGLRSTVRRIIDPHAPSASYDGLLNTAGTARGVHVDAEPGTMNMIFGKRCFFCYILHPCGDVWWFANPVRAKEPSDTELREINTGFKSELLRLVEVDKTPAREIIQASEDVFPPFATYHFPSVPIWHRGRMLIVGDAAHATSPAAGQGAAQAVEDAVTLGKCLRDNDEVAGAFDAYEARRRDRVEAIVAQGRSNSSGKAPGPMGRVIRDFFIARAFKKTAASTEDPQRWMWDHHIDWETPGRVDRQPRAELRN